MYKQEGETEWQSVTVKTDYDEQGQVTGEYTPRGTQEDVAAKYEYDILGQMIRFEIPQEKADGSIVYQTITAEYDNSGNVTEQNEQIDSDRTAKTEYTYDKLGNLVMVKSCIEGDEAQYVQYVYDVQGNKVRQFTGMTAPLTLTVSEVADATADADTFSYAGKTYQIAVSGQKKGDDIRESKYEYDGKNQLTAFIDPEGRRESYTYDVNSNLTKTVDKNGNTQKNIYDYQNRLTEMVAKEKKTGKETKHTYTYNAYGDVATQDDTAFEYDDASGGLTKETTKLTKNKNVVKNYSYDSADNISAFSVQVGGETKLSLQYGYDGESKLTSVTDGQGNQVVGYSYDTDGNLSGRSVSGNGLTTAYTYDYQNRLTAMKNQTGSAGVISEYSSEYLINGQKSKETSDVVDKDGKKNAKTATYTYDLLGRITRETKTGSEDISYTYDSNNNRREMTVGNKVTSYTYNKNDELLRTDTLNTDTEKDSVVIYKYDKNGNQLATVNRYEIPSDQKNSIYIDIDVTLGDNRLNENVVNHYNAENQLIQTLTKNYKVGFTYDAEGLRTSKTVNGEKTVFVWDGDQLVMELSESGKVQKRYIRGNDLVYADKGEGTEKQYYVTDPHGNVVQLTDEDGNVIKTYEYDSFGKEENPDSKDENPFRYCGEYYDKETDEIYLRARYYQPAVGRFLTRDTYTGEDDESLSLHLYTYCENDGVNLVDSNGHWGRELTDGKKDLYKMNNVTDQPKYKFVHKNITNEAVGMLGAKWRIGITTQKFKSLIKGSVLPDRLKQGKDTKNKVVLGIKIRPQKKFHGKVKKELNSLKKEVLKRIKKKGKAKKKYLLIGAVLHSIQDYQAHSYYSDVQPIRDMVKTKTTDQIKIKDENKKTFHRDWLDKTKKISKKKAVYKHNSDLHSRFKDNPYYDFRKNSKGTYQWVKVTTREENQRYLQARKQSKSYLETAMKKMPLLYTGTLVFVRPNK